MSNTRLPIQKRSIEKRNKIIDKGFELMCKKGYFNTTTNDIAEYSNVSVGIIYQYFNDKKDIFMEGVKKHSNEVMFPIYDTLDKIDLNNNLEDILNIIIDIYLNAHKKLKLEHEEMTAMSHIDEDINKLFMEEETILTDKLYKLFKTKKKNMKEKIHICIGLVENLCHEIIYHKHKNYDYDVMKKEVINIIISILK